MIKVEHVLCLQHKVLVLGEENKRLTIKKDKAEGSVFQLSKTLRHENSNLEWLRHTPILIFTQFFLYPLCFEQVFVLPFAKDYVCS